MRAARSTRFGPAVRLSSVTGDGHMRASSASEETRGGVDAALAKRLHQDRAQLQVVVRVQAAVCDHDGAQNVPEPHIDHGQIVEGAHHHPQEPVGILQSLAGKPG